MIALVIFLFSFHPFLSNYIDQFILYTLEFINPNRFSDFETFVKNFLSNTKELGSLGIVYMLFVFSMFFKDYEYIINKLHKTKSRSFWRYVLAYLALVMLIPLIFAIFFYSMTLLESSLYHWILTTLFATSIMIMILKISINDKLFFIPLLSASLLIVVFLFITQQSFVYYVQYNTTYQSIYGSFSIALFFFLWIYVNWIIYLYGIKLLHRLNVIAKRKKEV